MNPTLDAIRVADIVPPGAARSAPRNAIAGKNHAHPRPEET